MPVSLSKVSGVLQVVQAAGYGRYYAATAVANGKFNANPAADGVNITVGADSYSISLADLRVNGQTPSSIGEALVLLNSIFGT